MRGPFRRFLMPRAHKAGAFCVGARATTKLSLLKVALFAVPLALTAVILSVAVIPTVAVAQIPGIGGPPPDTILIGADSTGLAPELAEADSIAILADSSEILADSLEILADSGKVAPKILPVISSGVGPSLS